MLEKIKMFPLMVYLTVTNYINDLKNDERGSSPVVDTILLVLVAVLAVVLVWGWLSGWLQDLFSQITGEAGKIK